MLMVFEGRMCYECASLIKDLRHLQISGLVSHFRTDFVINAGCVALSGKFPLSHCAMMSSPCSKNSLIVCSAYMQAML